MKESTVAVAKGSISTVARGLWCNLCGARLAGGNAPLQLGRRLRRAEHQPGGAQGSDHAGASAWSICVQCYQERLRCAACGVAVGSQAFMLEGDRHFYCARCFSERPRCDTCDRPAGALYWSAPGGRRQCDRCHATAITDSRAAQLLYMRVRSALAHHLGMVLKEQCQLRLVSRRHLLSIVEKSSLHSLDADSRGRCFGLFLHQGSRRAIYAEYGLPQIVLLEVLAHELAHAWQSENCKSNLPVEVQEGFAEWAAFKLLDGWGCRRRSDRMLRRDDLYGRGLRLALGWEAHGGVPEVFRQILNPRPV